DGWSEGVFTRELRVLYAAARGGRGSPLPPLPVQYADFAIWQRAWLGDGALAAGLAYWRRQLADCPEQLALPTDRARGAVQWCGGGGGRRAHRSRRWWRRCGARRWRRTSTRTCRSNGWWRRWRRRGG